MMMFVSWAPYRTTRSKSGMACTTLWIPHNEPSAERSMVFRSFFRTSNRARLCHSIQQIMMMIIVVLCIEYEHEHLVRGLSMLFTPRSACLRHLWCWRNTHKRRGEIFHFPIDTCVWCLPHVVVFISFVFFVYLLLPCTCMYEHVGHGISISLNNEKLNEISSANTHQLRHTIARQHRLNEKSNKNLPVRVAVAVRLRSSGIFQFSKETNTILMALDVPLRRCIDYCRIRYNTYTVRISCMNSAKCFAPIFSQ